jgi:hypothetical protein
LISEPLGFGPTGSNTPCGLRLEFRVIQVMPAETLLSSLGVKRLGEVLSSFGIRLAEPMLIKKTAEARIAELRNAD